MVYGLMQEKDPAFEMSLVEIGVVGLPVAMAGLVFILIFAPRWLPDREGPLVNAISNPREYVMASRGLGVSKWR